MDGLQRKLPEVGGGKYPGFYSTKFLASARPLWHARALALDSMTGQQNLPLLRPSCLSMQCMLFRVLVSGPLDCRRLRVLA